MMRIECKGADTLPLDPIYCDVIRRRWTKWARENGHDVGTGGLEPIEENNASR